MVVAIVFPLVRKPIVCPGFKDDLDRLVEPRRALFARQSDTCGRLAMIVPGMPKALNSLRRTRAQPQVNAPVGEGVKARWSE
jgi:hypothetical protein